MLQLEGKSLVMADAETDAEATNAFNAIAETFFSNPEVFITNSAARRCLDWPMDDLVFNLEAEGGPTSRVGRVATLVGNQLRERIKSEFNPKILAIKQTYQNRAALAQKQLEFEKQMAIKQQEFEKQKAFLMENSSFDQSKFGQLDSFISCGKLEFT